MIDPEDVARQHALLATYRQTLHHYLQQQAALGAAYAPPAVANGIADARAHITRIKAILRQQGAAVADDPDDDAPQSGGFSPTMPQPRQRHSVLGVFVLGAVMLVALVFARTWFVAGRQTPPPATQGNPTAVQAASLPVAPAVVAAADAPRAVALPKGNSVLMLYGGGKLRYSILQADVQPVNADTALLRLVIRAEVMEGSGINFWSRDFRLKIDGKSLLSDSPLNEAVYVNETKDGTLEFQIPAQADQAVLTCLTGNTSAELLLVFQAAGATPAAQP